MNDYALYIGRFQPFHHGHLASLKHAFTLAKKVIIILGSYKLASSLTDPWTVLERKKMILSALIAPERRRVQFIFIRDRLYNEDLWKENLIREVEFKTKSLTTRSPLKIVIVGHMKDNTSYYLKIFPQWPLIETGNFYNLNSTQFRTRYFSNQHLSYNDIPKPIATFLKDFRKTKTFKLLQNENEFLKLNTSPLTKKIFYACLVWGHYILLEKRSNFPGKNLYSLPNYQLFEKNNALKQYVTDQKNFYLEKYDGNNKSGKDVICYYIPPSFKLFDVELKNQKYTFVLLDDLFLMENQMFSDHYQIIKTILRTQ